MLRQLMLSRKLAAVRAALEELLAEQAGFDTRSEELAAAIDEAKTDEELAAVEEAVGELEGEKAKIAEQKSKLEGEIAALEGQLDELKANDPGASGERAAGVTSRAVEPKGGEGQVKVKRGFFRGMTRDAAAGIVAREDVKEFLERTRELIGVKRAVTGADLLVPEVLLGILRDTLHQYSKLISHVNLRTVRGTARQTVAGAIPEAIWTEMVGKLNEVDITFNQLEVDGYKVGGFMAVPNSTVEDSDINLASEIMYAIGQGIGLALDKAILYGTGTKMPVGIVTRLVEESKPGYWGNKERSWTDLHTSHVLRVAQTSTPEAFFSDLILKLGVAEANYADSGQFWAMSTKTFRNLQAKALLFNAAGAIVSGIQNTMPIIGGTVVLLDFIPEHHVIGGYGSLYLLVERAGATFAASEHAQFIEDNTVFKGTARYDGRPVFGEAFVALTLKHDGSAPDTGDVAFAPDSANP